MSTRRDALAFLGLVRDDSPALATEHMVRPLDSVGVGTDWHNGRAVAALRRLVDGIESGRVEVMCLEVYSRLQPNDILTQTLSIEFNLPEAFTEPS